MHPTRWTALVTGLCCMTGTPGARATPVPLTAVDRVEIERLARTFFETTRDGSLSRTLVYPSLTELRGLFPTPSGAGPDQGPTAVDALINRHVAGIEADVTDLRTLFHGGTFTGLAPGQYPRGTVEQHPCGRYAVPDSACMDGPVLTYTVNGTPRRFRVQTLVRVGGHFRIFDPRP